MPLTIPGAGVLLTRDNFAVAVKSFVDGLETTVTSMSTSISSLTTGLTAKYTLPADGKHALATLPAGSVIARYYVNGAWELRGTARTDLCCQWVKTDAAQPNPPFTTGYAIAGPDTLLAATA